MEIDHFYSDSISSFEVYFTRFCELKCVICEKFAKHFFTYIRTKRNFATESF